MEKRNTGKINLSTIIIIIAILIIIIMSGLMYKILQDKENKNVEIEMLTSKINTLENEKLEDSSNENSQTSAFEKYQKNYKKSFEELISQHNQISIWLADKGIQGLTNVYVDSDGDAYIETSENSELRSKYGKNKQVNTNIASIDICSYGNSGLYDIVFLKNDGTADKINGAKLANGEIAVENIANIKNAVNIISYMELNEMGAGVSNYAFIDVDGNIIK